LLELLKGRIAQLADHPSSNSTEKSSKVEQENFSPQADLPGNQPLPAGTPPVQGRNDDDTPPEHSAHSAGTSRARKRLANESPLDDLPSETQAIMLHILQTHTLDEASLEITAKPPYGLGIATSRSSLQRFLERHNAAKITRHRQQVASEIAKLIGASKSLGELSLTAAHLIELRLLETAISEKSDPQSLLALSRSLDRLRASEHSERRIRLAELRANAPLQPK